MRRLAPALLVFSVACSGGVITSTTTPAADAGPITTASACATGFAEHLVKIEPIVDVFDPTTMALRELLEIEEAAGEMLEPDLTGPFNCEDEGLNWAYFSWQSAWDEILSIARNQAPGTIPFLEAFRQMTSLDEPALAEVAMPTCEALVNDLERAMEGQAAAGNQALFEAPFGQAIEILTLSVYITYLENDGPKCMPDELRAQVEAIYPPRPISETITTEP